MDHEPGVANEFIEESGIQFKPMAADKTLALVAFECLGGLPSACENALCLKPTF
jgi:hypothetical protein